MHVGTKHLLVIKKPKTSAIPMLLCVVISSKLGMGRHDEKGCPKSCISYVG